MPTIKKRGYATKKQPEQEIVTIANKFSAFTAANRKVLTIGAWALVAILVLGGGYSLMRSMREQKAAPLVASAYEQYSPDRGAAPDYAKALDLFRSAQKQYPSTMSGAIAQYYVGNCLVNLGRNDEALKEYKAFAAKYAGDKFLLGLVYQRIGYVQEALGRPSDAIKAFEQSESLIGPGVSTVELAKLYESAGNIPESRKKYKSIADNLAGTRFAMEAVGKVQQIAPSPVPAPAPVNTK